jgi:hypothetical protein
MRPHPLTSGLTLLLLLLAPVSVQASTCAELAALKLPYTSITSAQVTGAGAFQLPSDGPRVDSSFFTAFKTLAAFCRVRAVIRPVADSHIEFEVWLPIAGWNGRYIAAGNGSYSGSINYYRLAEAIQDGAVGSATDVGHKDADQQWWVGHPERVHDFDYRAIHETAIQARAVTKAFYDKPAAHAYFISCSNGGRQGLVEAQRFPTDYDGIVAGAPAYEFGANLDGSTRVPALNWRTPSLEALKEHGGRLIIYHGGNDGPRASVDFYRRLTAHMGKASVDDFVRLYVVPGMGHCGGGAGPDPTDIGERLRPGQDAAHSVIRALERWVETGVAPHEIVATKYRMEDEPGSGVVRTRPICPYPAIAIWNERGDRDDAASYSCKPPNRRE